RGHEATGGTVSALRLPEDSRVSSTRRSSHESASGLSTLASVGTAVAAPASASTCREFPAPAAASEFPQSCLGLRLRVRRLRQRPAGEMLDRDRRVHPGMLGY